MNAHLYLRVSTQNQAKNGVSLGSEDEDGFQERKCRAFCDVRDWPVASVESEPMSGRSMKRRPGLQAALDRVCEDKGVLVFYNLSRLTRNATDGHNIKTRLFEAGAAMASATETIDTRTAMGRFQFTVMLGLCEFSSDIISEGVTAARTQLVSKLGINPMGSQRYGWRYDKELELLVEIPEQQAAIRRAKELAADDRRSVREIAATMALEGFKGRRGGPFNAVLVCRILGYDKTPAGPDAPSQVASE